uniref:Type I cytokine receptor cytokine-binding domain-containing protein n=1 Tax=Chelonoidis abingdonii TaxID=106734 RepID=A0A8C0JF93_CHEAB
MLKSGSDPVCTELYLLVPVVHPFLLLLLLLDQTSMNGTSVENFSCVIYNISFMNCTWEVGRNAPEDTRYFLFWQYSKEEDEQECPHYIGDATGRHIACSFQDVKNIKNTVYFLVNGSSNESEIQFYDEYINLYEIEKLTPPLNITVSCSEDRAECRVRWKWPQISHLEGNGDGCFEYQIDIRNKKTNVMLHLCTFNIRLK